MAAQRTTLRIGNGAGFLGDWIDAPRLLVEGAARDGAALDYLTLEYLAELTLSILARVREKDPQRGYAGDFVEVLASLCPALAAQPQLKIVTNAGGMNPAACAAAAGKVLAAAGLGEVPIGVVTGDDLLPRMDELRAAGCTFANLETAQPLSSLAGEVVSANAYLGARGIVDALVGGARIVITGRVADASLTVAPAVHEFAWSWDDWTRLAGASVAGHLIECGAQVTGGYSNEWRGRNLADVGYPIAELQVDGTATITKPANSGGLVTRTTVAEQLVYEIGDPRHYLTPDVDVDFTTVELADAGPDRVRVSGATGRPAPATLKVSLAYRAGFAAAGQLVVVGRDAADRAREAADIVLARLAASGVTLDAVHVELLGTGDATPGLGSAEARAERASTAREVVMRMAVQDRRRDAVARFTREIAPLITSGPAGLAGYAAGRPEVRPVFAYWPTLASAELVKPCAQVAAAGDWAGR
jgi:hypothetical protein